MRIPPDTDSATKPQPRVVARQSPGLHLIGDLYGCRGHAGLMTDAPALEAFCKQAVLDAGRTLWQAYFAYTDARTVRDEYKLNRPDVGWYQIRNALKARNSSGDTAPVNFGPFESAYQALTEKLQPQVFSLGFLR